jgi:hypothetical protein
MSLISVDYLILKHGLNIGQTFVFYSVHRCPDSWTRPRFRTTLNLPITLVNLHYFVPHLAQS